MLLREVARVAVAGGLVDARIVAPAADRPGAAAETGRFAR